MVFAVSRIFKKAFILGGYAIGAFLLVIPAHAQFSASREFLESVKDRDGQKATEFIDEPGSGAVLINTRDSSSGKTALHYVVQDRDETWTGFLLAKGANPDLRDKKGVTPLILATQLGFTDGVEKLIRFKVDVNGTNRSGETPLILAVQLNRIGLVRILMKGGADPDKTDNLAGLSARDYAARDSRKKAILAAIESGEKKAKDEEKPEEELDFSGIREAS
ncbi:MAG: ankyrin repeat domain-containing protein [Sphingorhabdus sp.]